jgi:hypothetical protein
LFGGSSKPEAAEAKEGWSAKVTSPSATAQMSSQKAEPRHAEAAAKRVQHARAKARRNTEGEETAAVPAATTQAAALVKEESGFDIDFGAAPSEHAAQAEAKAIKAKTADILISRELTLLPAGGQVRILAGPYKSQGAANALCSTIKARGVTCKVTVR